MAVQIGSPAGVRSVTGTANQIVVSSTTGDVVLSTPQNLGTGSTPQFAGLTLTSPMEVASGGTGAATLSGILKGNGTSAFSAASAATDYVAPGAITGSGLTTTAGKVLGRITTGSGAVQELEQTGYCLAASTAVDLNTTGDVVTFTNLPAKYIVDKIVCFDWSTTPSALLAMTLRDAASGGGNSLVGTIGTLNAVVTATALGAVAIPLAAVLGASRVLTAPSLYLNVSAANGSALTSSVKIFVTPL